MSGDLAPVLAEIGAEMAARTDRGRVADYIPELATVDPAQFALSVATADGRLYSTGDAGVAFSVQSVSKVFALALALGRLGDGDPEMMDHVLDTMKCRVNPKGFAAKRGYKL